MPRLLNASAVRYFSRPYAFRTITIAVMMAAMPEKIAPTTKYGPKIDECHIGWIVIANTHDTTVCTEIATGITRIAITEIARSRRCHWCGAPVQPSERRE